MLDKIKGSLPGTDAISLAIKLVRAVHKLHKLGFQHHAISPRKRSTLFKLRGFLSSKYTSFSSN